MPLVIVSHGLNGCRSLHSAFCTELASEGFIVVSIEHRFFRANLTMIVRTWKMKDALLLVLSFSGMYHYLLTYIWRLLSSFIGLDLYFDPCYQISIHLKVPFRKFKKIYSLLKSTGLSSDLFDLSRDGSASASFIIDETGTDIEIQYSMKDTAIMDDSDEVKVKMRQMQVAFACSLLFTHF